MSKNELKEYMRRQLNNYFPDNYDMVGNDVDIAFDLGLERLENCFKYLTFPAYCDDLGQTYFSHLHGDQYAQFLYYFSNSLWKTSENKPICDKLMYLNRVLNNFFFSYKGKLPDIFFLGHPIGTILGNAVYSDFLVVFQNVTINTSADEQGNPAPVLGKGLFMGAGAKIIGNKPVGDRVSISVDTVVYDKAIPNDKVVLSDSEGNIVIKDRKKNTCMAQNYFRVPIE
ncbi:MAG: hypothetical protein E7271_08400 [Lachnospiraceae bacterium]|nr:hypothetical protein [Lachnospiraceae bacterium]